MSNNLKRGAILLVGVGRMGTAYAGALSLAGCPFVAVGRGDTSAATFAKATGQQPVTGGLREALEQGVAEYREAIVALPVQSLAEATRILIERGVKKILVEKPGGINAGEIAGVEHAAAEAGAEVFVGYNRRFYGSVRLARRMVREDGGATSMSFEFTERSDVVAASEAFPAAVKANWLLANSTHVIDTAFHLAGEPAWLHAASAGSLSWHPSAARFAGLGTTTAGALFSYHADWEAPGRWGIDVMTPARHIVLRPMEELYIQKHGTFELLPAALDDDADSLAKPGLLRQVEAFLSARADDRLVTIRQHSRMAAGVYSKMAYGGSYLPGSSEQ